MKFLAVIRLNDSRRYRSNKNSERIVLAEFSAACVLIFGKNSQVMSYGGERRL